MLSTLMLSVLLASSLAGNTSLFQEIFSFMRCELSIILHDYLQIEFCCRPSTSPRTHSSWEVVNCRKAHMGEAHSRYPAKAELVRKFKQCFPTCPGHRSLHRRDPGGVIRGAHASRHSILRHPPWNAAWGQSGTAWTGK